MRILHIGDIVGKSGRTALKKVLPPMLEADGIDLVMANVENAAGVFGVTPKIGDFILSLGVDVMTSGNHIWDKKVIYPYLEEEPRILRPLNYPPDSPGRGWGLFSSRSGKKVGVINASGRIYMDTIDCPFRMIPDIADKLSADTDVIMVDFHGEASSEKVAMGWYLDGRVSAVLGTHTHVQTADEQILPRGTAYVTDIGMTGSFHSVIGVKIEDSIDRIVSQRPNRLNAAQGREKLCGVVVEIDDETGRAVSIERVCRDAEFART